MVLGGGLQRGGRALGGRKVAGIGRRGVEICGKEVPAEGDMNGFYEPSIAPPAFFANRLAAFLKIIEKSSECENKRKTCVLCFWGAAYLLFSAIHRLILSSCVASP